MLSIAQIFLVDDYLLLLLLLFWVPTTCQLDVCTIVTSLFSPFQLGISRETICYTKHLI